MSPIEVDLEVKISEAEAKAWDSLARYKFLMFGYHAAQWVTLNQLCRSKKANPWRGLVALARTQR